MDRKKRKFGSDGRLMQQMMTRDEAAPSTNYTSYNEGRNVFHVDSLTSCRSIKEYQFLNDIKAGSYGEVFRARDRTSGEVVAVKKLRCDKRQGDFPVTGYREIGTLRSLNHHGIVHLREVVLGSTADQVFLVMEYMEYDLKGLIDAKARFLNSQVKSILLQTLSALNELHSHWIVHRDLKTSNLLLNRRGQVKVADFGLARWYADPLPQMTPLVVTLWNRCPELLLGSTTYGTEVDMWSVGCIFGELFQVHPFQGKGDIDQLFKIFEVLGSPNVESCPELLTLPHAPRINFASKRFPSASQLQTKYPTLPSQGLNLMTQLLCLSPSQRVNAADAIRHPYFMEEPRGGVSVTLPVSLPTNTHHQTSA